jgi:hypothetical protein
LLYTGVTCGKKLAALADRKLLPLRFTIFWAPAMLEAERMARIIWQRR